MAAHNDFTAYLASKTCPLGEITIDDISFTPAWDIEAEDDIILYYRTGLNNSVKVSVPIVHAVVALCQIAEREEKPLVSANLVFSGMMPFSEFKLSVNLNENVHWPSVFHQEKMEGSSLRYVVLDGNNIPYDGELTDNTLRNNNGIFITHFDEY